MRADGGSVWVETWGELTGDVVGRDGVWVVAYGDFDATAESAAGAVTLATWDTLLGTIDGFLAVDVVGYAGVDAGRIESRNDAANVTALFGELTAELVALQSLTASALTGGMSGSLTSGRRTSTPRVRSGR